MKLNDLNLDILRELSNIASGHAISALADLTGKKLDIHVPSISTFNYKDVPMILGNEEEIVISIFQEVMSGFDGDILFVVDEISFKRLIFELLVEYNPYRYNSYDDIDILNLDDMESSAIQEVGNILTGSYLNAISEFIGKEINPSVPIVTVDMAATILYESLVAQSNDLDEIFVIKTELFLDENRLNSQIFLIPRKDGVSRLINKIREKYNIYE